MAKSALDWVALILLIIGGLNLGLTAISADYDMLAKLGATIARIVYALVGLAALYTIYFLVKK